MISKSKPILTLLAIYLCGFSLPENLDIENNENLAQVDDLIVYETIFLQRDNEIIIPRSSEDSPYIILEDFCPIDIEE